MEAKLRDAVLLAKHSVGGSDDIFDFGTRLSLSFAVRYSKQG